MARILSLDTSTKVCSIALHEDGLLIGSQAYYLQQSHSSLLPVIIKELITNCELTLGDLDAIAVSGGPGSYTGLRIGTATAKGLAFALDLPLIALDSLDSMIAQVRPFVPEPNALFCPMIDARRMEVYCKLVNQQEAIWNTHPLVVEDAIFSEFKESIYLFGNGSDKLKTLFSGSQFHFISNIHPKAEFMGTDAFVSFKQNKFEDLAYFEPDYLKEYRTNTPSKKFSL